MQTHWCYMHTIILEKLSIQKCASVIRGSLQCFDAGVFTALVPFAFKRNPLHVFQPTTSSPTPFMPQHQFLKRFCFAGDKLAKTLEEVKSETTAETDRLALSVTSAAA